MIDSITGEPIRISEKGLFSPFIRLPLDQLELVRKILVDAAIRHSTTGPIITYQGKPPITKIYLGYDTDLPPVQFLLAQAKDPRTVAEESSPSGHRG